MRHLSSPNTSETITERRRSTRPDLRAALCCTLTLCLMLGLTACVFNTAPDSATPTVSPATMDKAPEDPSTTPPPPAEDSPAPKLEGESPTRGEPGAAHPARHDEEGVKDREDEDQTPGPDNIGKLGGGDEDSPTPAPEPSPAGADHDTGGPQGGVDGDLTSPKTNRSKKGRSKKVDPNDHHKSGVEGQSAPSRSKKKSSGYREEFGIE